MKLTVDVMSWMNYDGDGHGERENWGNVLVLNNSQIDDVQINYLFYC